MGASMRPFGGIVIITCEAHHSDNELSKLAGLLKSPISESRVVMETTGNYNLLMARSLHNSRLYIYVVNAKIVRGYGTTI